MNLLTKTLLNKCMKLWNEKVYFWYLEWGNSVIALWKKLVTFNLCQIEGKNNNLFVNILFNPFIEGWFWLQIYNEFRAKYHGAYTYQGIQCLRPAPCKALYFYGRTVVAQRSTVSSFMKFCPGPYFIELFSTCS